MPVTTIDFEALAAANQLEQLSIQQPSPLDLSVPPTLFVTNEDDNMIFRFDSDSDSLLSDEMLPPPQLNFLRGTKTFCNQNFLSAIYAEFSKLPNPLRNAIGDSRFPMLVNDLLSTIICLSDIPYEDCAQTLVDYEDALRSEGDMGTIPYPDALDWTAVIINKAKDTLLTLEYYRARAVSSTEERPISQASIFLASVCFVPARRAHVLTNPDDWTILAVEVWRAECDYICMRATIALRVMLTWHGYEPERVRGVDSVRRLEWTRRQKMFVSVRGIGAYAHVPIPNFVQNFTSEFSEPPFVVQAFEDADPATVEQGFKDVISSLAGRMASGAVGAGIDGVTSAVSELPAFQFVKNMANTVGTTIETISRVVGFLFRLFPVIAPVFSVLAAHEFARTGELKWGFICFTLAVTGAFYTTKWFINGVLPWIARVLRAMGPRGATCKVASQTDFSIPPDFDMNEEVPEISAMGSMFSVFSSLWSRTETSVSTETSNQTTELDFADTHEQSGFSDSMPAEMLSSLLSAALLSTGLFVREPYGLITAFAKFNAVSSGVKGLLHVFINLSALVMDRLVESPQYSNIPLLQGKDMTIAEYCDKVNFLIVRNNKGRIPRTENSVAQMREIVQVGRSLMTYSQQSPLSHILSRRIEALERLANEIATRVATTGVTRAQPVNLLLVGSPGSGKTVLAYNLAAALVHIMLEDFGCKEEFEAFKADSSSLLYTMPRGMHFDGLENTTRGIIWDDFGQIDPKSLPYSPGGAMIDMSGVNRWNPPMAQLEKKNNVSVAHDFLIATSNKYSAEDKTILEPDALGRRPDIVVYVGLKEGYDLKQKVGFDPDVYELYLMAYVPEVRQWMRIPNEKIITVHQLFHMVIEKIRSNRESHQRTVEGSDAFYERMKKPVEDFSPAEALRRLKSYTKFGTSDGCTLPREFDFENRTVLTPEAVTRRRSEGPYVNQAGDNIFEAAERRFGPIKPEFAELAPDPRTRRVRLSYALQACEMPVTEEEFSTMCSALDVDVPHWKTFTVGELMAFINTREFSIMYIPKVECTSEIETIQASEMKTWIDGVKEGPMKLLLQFKDMLAGVSVSQHILPVAASVLTGILAAMHLSSVWDRFFGTEQSFGARPLAKTPKGKSSAQRKAMGRMAARRAKEATRDVQDQANIDSILAVVDKAREAVRVERTTVDGVYTKPLGHAIAVSGRLMAIPLHFFMIASDMEEEDDTLTLEWVFTRGGRDYRVNTEQVFLVSEIDIHHDRVLIEIRSDPWDARPNILKHFATEQEIKNTQFSWSMGIRAALLFPSRTVYEQIFTIEKLYLDNDNGNVKKLRMDNFHYRHGTVPGDCGVPLVGIEGKVNNKILGFHFSGNGKGGNSVPLPREWILGSLGKVEPSSYAPLSDTEISTLEPVLDHSLEKLNFHPKECPEIVSTQVSPPSNVFVQNSIVPWEPNGSDKIPQERKLMASDTHPRTFTSQRADLEKAQVKNPKFFEVLPALVDHVVADINRADHLGIVHRKLSFIEAINGVEAIGLAPIDLSSSVGYPWSSKNIKRTEFLIGNPDGSRSPGPRFNELKKVVEHFEYLGQNGWPLPHIWQIMLKGEKRKIAKVLSGKTRDINCANFGFLILCRMYMGTAICACVSGAPDNDFLITADGTSAADWDDLARRLIHMNPNEKVGAGDHQGFDHHHALDTLKKGPCEVLRRLYTGYTAPQRRVLESIFESVYSPMFIFGSVVERREGSMPSGFLGTTVFNCIINKLGFLYAWLKMNEFDLTVLPLYRSSVAAVFCGDDNIFAPNPAFEHVFTEAALADAFADLGYVYTAADKTEAKAELGPLELATMTKRSFRFEPALGKYVGPLDLDVVLELCTWTKSGQDANVIGATNVRTSIEELSLHGKETFHKWLPKILEHSKGFYHPPTTDWNVILPLVAKDVPIDYSAQSQF